MEEEKLYFIGIKFIHSSRSYFFSTKEDDFKINDQVLVETAQGKEIGFVSILPRPISEYNSPLNLSPIIRKANDKDKLFFKQNVEDAKIAAQIFNQEQAKLDLNMRLIYADYTIDKTRITFTYSSDDRVDFRELLKVLATRLRTRIELRQIGPRDKAKLIGGIGICGLPLCCTTFLNEFDGISINRAKNQMLAINIPKLSGQCGKLVCCLKYEDDAYTDLKQLFPAIDDTIEYNKQIFSVSSYNVISSVITLVNEENDTIYLTLEEYNKIKLKKSKHDKKKHVV